METTQAPERELTVEEARAKGNLIPDDWPKPRTLSEVQRLAKESLLRMLNAIVRAQIVKQEGGRLPEQTVLEANLSMDLAPSGLVAYRWRSEAIVMFTPAGFSMSDSPNEGLVWKDAEIAILKLGESKVLKVGGN